MRTLLSALFASLLPAAAAAATLPPLLPMPKTVQAAAGSFVLRGATIDAAAPAEEAAAHRFADLVARGGGPAIRLATGGAIRFRLDPAVAGAEAYRLHVGPDGARVTASTAAGLFYGAETLAQLAAAGGPIAAVDIADAPSFAWRGVMLDSARHFQPAAYVEQLIDRMAEAKLNTLHWHLVDDQGWRVPIDRYPRLISIGAWRHEAGSGQRYGGFYTKAEIRAVVAYAAARHVTIVPEFDVPGHATALVAAYPQLASVAHPPAEPSNEYGVLPNLLNPDEASITFMQNVLDEVMALFPGRYIHLGGDEAVKDQWRANPAIQARMHALGLKDEDALQGWFTGRLGAYLAAHGRTLIGWDEILTGAVPPGAAITSWHGVEGAVAAAKMGHDAVLAPAPTFYLDFRQSDAADEPAGRGELVDWRHLYAFNPAPAGLTPDQRRHILGLQVNLWTEHQRTLSGTDRMIWPRAGVLAEMAWSGSGDWNAFAPRLVAGMARWRRLGWAFDETPLAPAVTVEAGRATLRQPAGIGVLRATTDGTAPTARSPLADAGFAVGSRPVTLAAQAFIGDQPAGPLRRWTLSTADALTRSGSELQLCDNAVPLRLQEYASTGRVLWGDVAHPCWIWKNAPLDGITGIRADVGQVPFNFADGAKPLGVRFLPPQTATGELVVRRGCDGPEIARLSLSGTVLRAAIPRQSGTADLCIQTAQAHPDPLWLLDRLTLEAGR